MSDIRISHRWAMRRWAHLPSSERRRRMDMAVAAMSQAHLELAESARTATTGMRSLTDAWGAEQVRYPNE